MANAHHDSNRQHGSEGAPVQPRFESPTDFVPTDRSHHPTEHLMTNNPSVEPQSPTSAYIPIADYTTLNPSTPSPPPESTTSNVNKLPDASSVAVVEPKEDPLPPPIRLSSREKLGLFALILFPLGSVIILIGLGFLWFLWVGGIAHNGLWHQIAARDWVTKAINIIAEVVKTIVGFQVGTEVAMIASIAMERFGVLLPHAASLSMMKAGASSGSVLVLLKHQFQAMTTTKSKKRTTVLIFALAATLAAVFAVAQVISILLISDTTVGVVHGLPGAVNLTLGKAVGAGLLSDAMTEDSTWLRAPARYPSFAEYSQPPYEADGILDTGVTLRAFLPFPDAQRRQLVQSYNGTATVLDARVTCQRPRFTNLSVTANRPGYLDLEGFIWSTEMTPRMVSGGEGTQYSSPFINTTAPAAHFFQAVAPMQSRDDNLWGLSITTTSSGGFMVSEFRNLAGPWSNPGHEYLVLNVSRGSMHDWSFGFPYNDTTARLNPLLSNRSEWLDMIFYNNYSYPLTLSATLCFAPWDQANIPVEITSNHNANRTESAPGFDLTRMSYDYTFLRRMYGQRQQDDLPLTIEERGILSLQNRSTWANVDDNTSASLSRASGIGGSSMMLGGTFSRTDLTQTKSQNEQLHPFDGMFFPMSNYKELAQEIVMSSSGGDANGDGIAFMIQSLITLQSSMSYYEVLTGYDTQKPVQVSYFVEATVPDSAVGITVVTAALGVHLLLMCVVLVLFLGRTKHSRLGATWAVMTSMRPTPGPSSPSGGETDEDAEVLERWLHGGADAAVCYEDDDQVASRMEKLGMARRRVGTRVVGQRVEVALLKGE